MRLFWIREVRYYKYAFLSCICILLCGYSSFNKYLKQGENSGVIIGTKLIHNITYTVPMYSVQKNNTIYIVYEHCVVENITKCNENHFRLNMMVYFEKINGFYVITNRNHFLLYFSVTAMTFSFLLMLLISYAYIDFTRLRNKEYKMWSKQKKLDIEMQIENDPTSFLFY
jgi:hypothetical protein